MPVFPEGTDREVRKGARNEESNDHHPLGPTKLCLLSGLGYGVVSRGCGWRLDGCDKAVAVTRKGFDEPRVIRRVRQGFAQAFDRCVQAVFEIDECICRPQLTLYLLAGHDLTGVF